MDLTPFSLQSDGVGWRMSGPATAQALTFQASHAWGGGEAIFTRPVYFISGSPYKKHGAGGRMTLQPIEPEIHRVEPESGPTVSQALIGIFSQTPLVNLWILG
jgi:hypothetical protein